MKHNAELNEAGFFVIDNEAADNEYKTIVSKFKLAEELLQFNIADADTILKNRGYFRDWVGDLFLTTVPVYGEHTLDICLFKQKGDGTWDATIKRSLSVLKDSDSDFVEIDIFETIKKIVENE